MEISEGSGRLPPPDLKVAGYGRCRGITVASLRSAWRPYGAMRYLFLLFAPLLFSSAASAQVIYSNLDPGGKYACCGGQPVRGVNVGPTDSISLAVSFTPANTLALASVQLAIQNPSPIGLDDVEAVLYSSVGGLPGAVIESLGTLSGHPLCGSTDSVLAEYASTLKPTLVAGTEYFIVAIAAHPDADASWHINITGAAGVYTNVGGGPWNFAAFPEPALRVNAVSAVPAVSTWTGFVLAVLMLGAGGRLLRQLERPRG